MAVILDRDRHRDLEREVREAGARIKSITDGDIAGAIMTCVDDSPADILLGIGGTPEGVTAACALKCYGGQILGRLWPRNDSERQAALDEGYDLQQVLTIEDLVRGDNVFFAATGVTDGEMLDGVRFRGKGAYTSSLVMRSRSGTIRRMRSFHDARSCARSPLSRTSRPGRTAVATGRSGSRRTCARPSPPRSRPRGGRARWRRRRRAARGAP